VRIGFFLVWRFGVMRRLFARTPLRFVVAWRAKSLRLAWRLDAAKRAAQFINFAFVREFLALGHFDELKHFVEMINHFFQTVGNFRGMFHGLADGRGVGGTKIRITRARCSLLRCRRAFKTFRAFEAIVTFGAVRPLRSLGHEPLRCRANIFNAFARAVGTFRFGARHRGQRRIFIFDFRRFVDVGGGGRVGNFSRPGGGRRIGGGRARPRATAPATAASAPAAVGTTGGRGRV